MHSSDHQSKNKALSSKHEIKSASFLENPTISGFSRKKKTLRVSDGYEGRVIIT